MRSDSKILESEYHNIIDLYNSGKSQQKIADLYGVSHSVIGAILKKCNVLCSNIKIKEEEYNNVVQLYQEGFSLKEIGKRYNACEGTVMKVLDKKGVNRRTPDITSRKYSFDEHYFDKIDTPNKAYILGLLYADGCNYEKNNGIRLELQEKDKDILEKINNELKNEKPLKFYERSKLQKGVQDTYTIEIFNKHFADMLAEKGVVPRKSLILKFPEWLNPDFYSFFILGYMDGDGCISKDMSRASFQMISTMEFCKSVAEILIKELKIDKYNIYKRRTECENDVFILVICGFERVKKVLDWLYRDADLYMQRKYDIYKSIYSNNNINNNLLN